MKQGDRVFVEARVARGPRPPFPGCAPDVRVDFGAQHSAVVDADAVRLAGLAPPGSGSGGATAEGPVAAGPFARGGLRQAQPEVRQAQAEVRQAEAEGCEAQADGREAQAEGCEAEGRADQANGLAPGDLVEWRDGRAFVGARGRFVEPGKSTVLIDFGWYKQHCPHGEIRRVCAAAGLGILNANVAFSDGDGRERGGFVTRVQLGGEVEIRGRDGLFYRKLRELHGARDGLAQAAE